MFSGQRLRTDEDLRRSLCSVCSNTRGPLFKYDFHILQRQMGEAKSPHVYGCSHRYAAACVCVCVICLFSVHLLIFSPCFPSSLLLFGLFLSCFICFFSCVSSLSPSSATKTPFPYSENCSLNLERKVSSLTPSCRCNKNCKKQSKKATKEGVWFGRNIPVCLTLFKLWTSIKRR